MCTNFSVHIKVDEKITLTAGRDGGLQNMEIRGLILLRVADAQFGKIRLSLENNDDKGFQMQVSFMLKIGAALLTVHKKVCVICKLIFL